MLCMLRTIMSVAVYMKAQGHRFFRTKLNRSEHHCAPLTQAHETLTYFENEWGFWCLFLFSDGLGCHAGGCGNTTVCLRQSTSPLRVLGDTNIFSWWLLWLSSFVCGSHSGRTGWGFLLFLGWDLVFTFLYAPPSCSITVEGAKSSR